MKATKKSWRRSAALVTALKDKPLHNAQIRLTGFYIILSLIMLAIFLSVLGWATMTSLTQDLHGKLSNPAIETEVVNRISEDLGGTAILLSLLLFIALSAISFFVVRMTLGPIKIFLEGHRRFIADASHELRTPLTTMRTELEVALLDPESTSKEEMADILRSNIEEIDRMSQILNNLLNLASFNDIAGTPPMNPVNIKEVLVRTAEKAQKYSRPKHIEVRTHNVEAVWVMGNSTALEEIMMNLVKNAIHYSDEGTSVSLTARELNDKYGEIIIKDQGVGIPTKDLPHVFEPFYRGEQSFHMHKSGTGLGLPIVREMIKRHKGAIHIESAPGKGTAITIHLPLAKEPKKEAESSADVA